MVRTSAIPTKTACQAFNRLVLRDPPARRVTHSSRNRRGPIEEVHAKDFRQDLIGHKFAAPAAAADRRFSRNSDANEEVVWWLALGRGTSPRTPACIQRVFGVVVQCMDVDI